MKTFVTFIVLLCIATGSFAQRLINRVDRQVAEAASRIDHSVCYFKVCLAKEAKIGVSASAQEKTFEITMSDPRITMGLQDYGTISGHIKNLTLDPVRLVFQRFQNRETNYDSGWTTSVCFGDLCYPAEKDFVPPDQAYNLPAGGEAEFKLNITSTLKYEDSILVHLIIAAVGSSEDDTVGLWMSAVSKGPAGVVADSKGKRSNIRAVFPSPLISGNSINVSVESIREAAYKYSIYDPFGREVAFGTSQRKLTIGNNVLSIGSLEGLGSGSYLLKLNFSDGSNDTYPFTVVR